MRSEARRFDVQGHRGCRGLRPENTLPAFEAALDLGVTTLELDLHFSKDSVPIVWHDPMLSPLLIRWRQTEPPKQLAIAALTLDELRFAIADGNPDPKIWTEQKAEATPAAQAWLETQPKPPFFTLDQKEQARADCYRLITLAELFAFVKAYAGETGKAAGKSETQRQRAAAVRFNVETKRDAKKPETIGDGFDGTAPGPFEKAALEAVRQADVLDRCVLQSFDQRSIQAAKKLEPKLTTAALFKDEAPADVVDRLKSAGAAIFAPNFRKLTAALTKKVQAAGYPVVAWTANEPADLDRLLDWDVDGIITDYPDRLIPKVQARHWTH